MANYSTAFGTVTISAETEELIDRLVTARGDAGGLVQINPESGVLVPVGDVPEGFEVSKKFEFTGEGRWNFDNTIDDFFDFFDEEPELAGDLVDHPFLLDWHVNDSECGIGFIMIFKREIRWDSALKTVVFYDIEILEDLPYTAANLIAYDFYEENEVIDSSYALATFNSFMEEIDRLIEQYPEEASTNTLLRQIKDNPDGFKVYLQNNKDSGVWTDVLDFLYEGLDLRQQEKQKKEFNLW